ncbi:tyrosine-protein phosphatase [Clostridium paraputrificum]|uniref:tyrosine-protein phosphatase n=1 Tax=Clostridium paraputrificum TaxID=29363 RepID=UPI00189E0377|nr:CpsB/CapC family capsule biosynthesis tyrosine phosphatase [Clostridium paraputrificum]MDB2116101.1 capsular biosynthesis protein [Clostridium paraputrificum]
MIDIHSHILPGIDDGAKNINMTLHMIKMAVESGTKDIVATPHFCRGYGETPYNEVKNLVGEFNKLSKGEGLDINIHYGQEVYYSEQIIDDYKSGLIGTINDSRYMLIELPMRSFDSDTLEVIYELQVKGVIPILAHPERYRPIIEKPDRINKFIKEGFLFQMNSGSIEGQFGNSVKKTAEILLDNNIYNFIGSDAHNDTNRCTGIDRGIELAKKKSKINEELFRESGRRLLNNEDIEFIGEKVKEKKGIFSFLK